MHLTDNILILKYAGIIIYFKLVVKAYSLCCMDEITIYLNQGSCKKNS